VDNGTVITLTFSAAAGSSGSARLYYWDGEGWIIEQAANYAASVTSIAFASTGHNEVDGWPGGFYACELQVASNETQITYVTISDSTTGTASPGSDIWEQHNLPQFSTNLDNYKDFRISSMSGLIKYTGTAEFAEGTCGQRQVKGNVMENNWFSSTVGVGYARIIGQTEKDTRFGRWHDGMYSFAKIASDNDMKKQNPCFFGQNQVDGVLAPADTGTQTLCTMAAHNLDLKLDYLIFYVVFNWSVSLASPSPGDSWAELWWATEYATDNTAIYTESPTMLPASQRLAIEAQTSTQQHYQNKIHLAGIWKTIGKVGRIAAPLLKMFGGVASMFGPHGAAIGGVANSLGSVAQGVGNFEEATRKRGWEGAVEGMGE
jgi:hypothetical protein